MITPTEKEITQKYLCLDIALQIQDNTEMLIEFQSITEMMHDMNLEIIHESTVEDIYRFLIRKKNEEKEVVYTKGHLIYLVKRTLKEFTS